MVSTYWNVNVTSPDHVPTETPPHWKKETLIRLPRITGIAMPYCASGRENAKTATPAPVVDVIDESPPTARSCVIGTPLPVRRMWNVVPTDVAVHVDTVKAPSTAVIAEMSFGTWMAPDATARESFVAACAVLTAVAAAALAREIR